MKALSRGSIDTTLALLVACLVVGGSLIFASAAFGLLARGTTGMSSVFFGHLVLGIGAGTAALIFMALLDYRRLRPYAPHLFAAAILLTLLVFMPHVGMSAGGGKRWIHVSKLTLQPSEFLKLAAILMASAYFAGLKGKATTLQWGLGGLCAILALPALILVAQPDIGTLGVICASVVAIFWTAGAKWWHMALLVVAALLAIGLLSLVKPYVRDRVETFFHPSHGQQAEGYQIRQSLIAVGSGGMFGRGFGQGIQKFTYLPEPMGDSIFAVAAEELGFVGALTIIGLFLAFALRGYTVATRSNDAFGSYLAIGISTYLTIEAFINISSMLGVAPLTGIPLTFISQGGSAMLASLASAGVLLSVSRQKRRKI